MRRQVSAAFLTLTLTLAASGAAPRLAVVPRASNFEALPLERSPQGHLLVRATLNGRPALLLVDSGAPVSAVALDRVSYYGMKPARADSDWPTRHQLNGKFHGVVMARSFQLGRLNLLDEPLVALDLSSAPAANLREETIDGIVGADILFPTKAVLDCRAQTLILKLDPKVRGGAPGLDYTGFRRLPLRVSAGHGLYVDGNLNGRAVRLRVDTGAYGTLLHQPFVRQMKIPLRRDRFGTAAGLNMKERGLLRATITRFSVGSLRLPPQEVGVLNLEGLIRGGLANASPPIAGFLGAEILRHHSGIIDFGTRSLYLKN